MNNIVNQTITPEAQAVKDMALAKMASLESIRVQRLAARDMLKDALLNSPDYKAANQEAEQVIKKRKESKARMMQQPQIYALDNKLKQLTREYNELKSDISDYLVTYQDKTGQLSFMDPEGREVKISRSAAPKIIKPKPEKKFRKK